MVAASVMVQRRSLDLLHPSQRYIGKCISQLYAEGILRRAPHKVVRLTRYGVSQLTPSERAFCIWPFPPTTCQAATPAI